jgi:hypothetical protein
MKTLHVVTITILIAILVFFYEPLSVTANVYQQSMNAETGVNYDSGIHYGYFFPVEFRASEDLFGYGNFKCAYEASRIVVGSLIRMDCNGFKPKWFWAWKYALKYGDVNIWAGYGHFVRQIFKQ